ncbi:rhomboid family intramembrane serine protease [Feifania hominis]|uniref:Rhomboid family intramembrane serine protease n=1 Tax=Feifania hominis TaxID=2763660 RepID=A0A926DEA8_9FIRM|nr:rhomboid family intramembrane serine protease [Feifania hominis]MBC8536246.1 rhomboid family intramembrane serine protease [Feifania hominis]
MLKKIHYNSPVVLTYFFVSLAVLMLGWLTGEWTTMKLFSVYRSSLADPLGYVRLFGHVLGHSGYAHFAGNMVLLLVVGAPLEEKYGSRTLLAGMALTALATGVLQCLFFPGSALLGASGVVFMLIMLSSLSGMREGSIPLTLILVAVLYLGQEVYAAVAVRDNVAHFMHLVGGACGTAFGYLVARRRAWKQ